MSQASEDRQRIDRWLWHARIVRTRNAAADLVTAGHVRVNGSRTTAPGRDIKCGDVITVALHGGVRLLRIIGTAPRRGDAAAASILYEELTERGLPSEGPSPPHGRNAGTENG